MQSDVTLRPMQPADGPAIEALGEQTPDTGAVGFRSRFHHDVYDTLLALRPTTIGVVATVPDHPGIVGAGMLCFGECWYEGAVRPFAYLYSLSVHPDYRRRGIASQLAGWRVAAARERFGNDGVIFAGIQESNTGSIRTAQKWSTQRIEGRTRLGVARVRSRPPRHVRGLEVRPARPEEFEQIATRQNAFYQEYNLYPPRDAQSLAAWHTQAPFGLALHDYYVAAGPHGTIIAGVSITDEGALISSQVVRMSTPLRVANVLLRIVPADGVSKRLVLKDFWFAPGHIEAGALLWESTRWLYRSRGTMVTLFFDPRSPIGKAIRLPRLMPSMGGSLVIAAPVPMREDRSIYHHI